MQVCPGWVRTRMGTSAATRSPEEGMFSTVNGMPVCLPDILSVWNCHNMCRC